MSQLVLKLRQAAAFLEQPPPPTLPAPSYSLPKLLRDAADEIERAAHKATESQAK